MFCEESILVIPCHFDLFLPWNLHVREWKYTTGNADLCWETVWNCFLILKLMNTLSSLDIEGSNNVWHLLIHWACYVFSS